jgi:hypothetical protein
MLFFILVFLPLSCLEIKDLKDEIKYHASEIQKLRVEIFCLAQGDKVPHAYRLAHCNHYPLTDN